MGLLAALSLCVDHKAALHADSVSRVSLVGIGLTCLSILVGSVCELVQPLLVLCCTKHKLHKCRWQFCLQNIQYIHLQLQHCSKTSRELTVCLFV